MLLFIIGYILAILFPIPLLNSGIISLWAKLFTYISDLVKGSSSSTTTPTPTTVAPSDGVTLPVTAPAPSTQRAPL